MKKYLVLMIVVTGLISSSAFAKGGYEVCKGVSKNGDTITLVGNFVDESKAYTIEVNAQGERLSYSCDPVDAGDVADGYTSTDNGGLKVTFYDEDNTASGWSKNLGAFKLDCQSE